MSLKSIKQAAEAYYAAQTGSAQEQTLAWRRLSRECSRTIESAIGHGYEARVVFYPPEKPKTKKKADHSASSSTTSS